LATPIYLNDRDVTGVEHVLWPPRQALRVDGQVLEQPNFVFRVGSPRRGESFHGVEGRSKVDRAQTSTQHGVRAPWIPDRYPLNPDESDAAGLRSAPQ
jgi:hypothetical protein